MADHNPARDAAVARLRARVKASTAVEEAFVEALTELLADNRHQMCDMEVRHLIHLIRRHRVSLIKQRAIMGAHGIDV